MKKLVNSTLLSLFVMAGLLSVPSRSLIAMQVYGQIHSDSDSGNEVQYHSANEESDSDSEEESDDTLQSFIWLVSRGDQEAVRGMATRNPAYVNELFRPRGFAGQHGFYSLSVAIMRANVELVRMLVGELGARIDIIHNGRDVDERYNSALEHARAYSNRCGNSQEIIAYLEGREVQPVIVPEEVPGVPQLTAQVTQAQPQTPPQQVVRSGWLNLTNIGAIAAVAAVGLAALYLHGESESEDPTAPYTVDDLESDDE